MKKILRVIIAGVIACCTVLAFSACGGDDDPNSKQYDSITKTLKLSKTYEGKNFYTDGIGAATLEASVDGDTTRFSLVEGGRSVTIRYYGIDTPESTGGVEKWGKSASNFVKSKLEAATELVLEASQTPAVTDSYGTRYLGYVWYKTADYAEFKNLNLEIVENGYSENKSQNTSAYPYYDYFKKAEDFAVSKQLHIHSVADDPLYSDVPIDITVKEFNEHTDLYYNEENDSGAKVRFVAYLKSLRVSESGTHTYVAEQYDPETGKTYQINVYTAYISSAASRMKLGHLYQIVGSIQNHYGSLQVSGVEYNALIPKDYNSHIKQYNYYLTFDSTVGYIEQNDANLYSDLTVTSVKVEGKVMTIAATAQKCTSTGYNDAAPFTFKVDVAEGYNPALKAGDKFTTHAYNFDNKNGFDSTKDVLQILSVSDIVKR